jgi:hypothetical protein
MALGIETGTTVKFQLEQQLLAEDGKLSGLAENRAEIELTIYFVNASGFSRR